MNSVGLTLPPNVPPTAFSPWLYQLTVQLKNQRRLNNSSTVIPKDTLSQKLKSKNLVIIDKA